MSLATIFLTVPALVLLIGIFYNTRSLYRWCASGQRLADRATQVAAGYAIVSLSLPLLLFINTPSSVRIVVFAVCALNFVVSLMHITRWFDGARQAENAAANKPKGK